MVQRYLCGKGFNFFYLYFIHKLQTHFQWSWSMLNIHEQNTIGWTYFDFQKKGRLSPPSSPYNDTVLKDLINYNTDHF